MIDDLKPYPAYRYSGVPLLGAVPMHWEVRRQRDTVQMRVSNVDKHSRDGELSVRLCNYVDVYKNDRITERVSFMQATAAVEEINRFRLRIGDVLITKDSESWNDIGVPALVEFEAPDLICGYHLALLRPWEGVIHGSYLFRLQQSQLVARQYHVEANGVTRYSLSHDAIRSIWLPIPSLEEQLAIVRFLDQADWRIQRYIRTKKKLIVLLNEQKYAIIERAVTRGHNPSAHLKPSGVGWLGEIPEHWEVQRAKELFQEVDIRSTTGAEILLSLRMHRGLVPHDEVSSVAIEPNAVVGFKLIEPGQVVMNRMRAAIGLFGVATQRGLISPDYAVFEARGIADPEYYVELFRTRIVGGVFRLESKGLGTGSAGFMRLYTDRFGAIKLPVPPLEEQRSIVAEVRQETANLERTITRIKREIDLLHEFRACLIADVVVGKLDVREAAARLPDISEKREPLDVVEPVGRDDEEAGDGIDLDSEIMA